MSLWKCRLTVLRLRRSVLRTPPSMGGPLTPHSGRTHSSTSKGSDTTVDAVRRVRELFQQAPMTDAATVWEALWKERTTPWDLGQPTAVLLQELMEYHRGRVVASQRKQQWALVPGCGAGYDLLSLKQFYETLIAKGIVDSACVVGLDLSETSLQHAKEVIQSRGSHKASPSSVRIMLVKGDFFNTETWKAVTCYGGRDDAMEQVLPWKPSQRFDFIFDYTFMCALPPVLRSQWGRTMAELLHRQGGHLLTLMFPLVPAVESTAELMGPPFAVTLQDYQQVLEPHGLVTDPACPRESALTVPQRRGQEQVCWWSRTTAINDE